MNHACEILGYKDLIYKAGFIRIGEGQLCRFPCQI